MGTWGEGNLDSDYALDELGERSDQLTKELVERAQRSESREPDEYDYTTLFVEFELLFALESKGLFWPDDILPNPSEVKALRDSHIADWDSKIDSVEPQEDHKRGRRKVILKTFDKFFKISRHYHKKWAKTEGAWTEMSGEEMEETFGTDKKQP